jgi:hypothetical protein
MTRTYTSARTTKFASRGHKGRAARYLLPVGVVCALLAGLLANLTAISASPAAAATTVIGFDPPSFTEGQVITSAPAVSLGAPAVVYTVRGATASPPQALRSTETGCGDSQCGTGANRLDLYFPSGLDQVSMSVGSPNRGLELCFPENNPCEVWARLVAFDATGTLVADSRDVLVSAFTETGTEPGSVVTPMAVTDPSGRIRSARLTLGEDLFDSAHENGNPTPFAIDDLNLSAPDTQPPSPSSPTPPTVTITTPAAGATVSYPYDSPLSGTVTPAAEVSAFCIRLNNPSPPPPSDCRQGGLLRSNGTFIVPIAALDPGPGSNAAYVFAYNLSGQLGSASRTFTATNPPGPSVVIKSPPEGQALPANSDVGLLLRLLAPGRIGGFCYAVNDPTVPPPSSCNRTAPPAQRTDYLFFDRIPAGAFGRGQNAIYVTLYDAFGQRARAVVHLNRPTNIRIAGVEVTQGIQTRLGFTQPQYAGAGLVESAANLPGPGVYTRDHFYAGTRMILGGQTVIRVFVNHDGGGFIPSSGLTVLVAGAVPRFDGSLRPIGTLVIPDFAPAQVGNGLPGLTDAVRGDQRAAFTFTLPRSWHNEIANAPGGVLDLRIKVALNGTTSFAQCAGCAADDEIVIHHIVFHPTAMSTPIHPVEVVYRDNSGVLHRPSPADVAFAQVEDIAPHTQDGFNVLPYIGQVDVTDIIRDRDAKRITDEETTDRIFGRVAAFGNGVNPPDRRIIGIMAPGIHVRGVEKPVTYCCDFKPLPLPRWEPIAIAEEDRPILSLLHEHFHQYGFFHAGILCPDVALAINWPPENRGELHGFALDRRASRRGADYSYRVMIPTSGQPLHDLMSYCATGEDDAWISPRNWDAMGNPLPNGLIPDSIWLGQAVATVGQAVAAAGRVGPEGKLPPATPARGVLSIAATVDAEDHVSSFQAQFLPGKSYAYQPKASPFSAVAYGPGDEVVARTLLYAPPGARTAGLVRSLQAAVDVPTDVRRIDILHGTAVLASRQVSAHPPQVTLLTPTRRTRIPAQGTVRVRWTASDPDGNRLATRLEYARDGTTFRTLMVGLRGHEAQVPAALLTRSSQARLRVVVNDGYFESAARSQPLRSRGASESLRIVSPDPRTGWRSGAPISLIAKALDADGHRLRGLRLHWLADGTQVAIGAQAQVKLRTGRHVIRVVAARGGLSDRVVITVRRR